MRAWRLLRGVIVASCFSPCAFAWSRFSTHVKSTMPKFIWTLWDGDVKSVPYLVYHVHRSWERLNPGWNFTVLTFGNLHRYMKVEKLKPKMTIQAKSDMIRLHVLSTHGGVWADSTMLCLQPLDSWIWPYLVERDFFMFGQGICSWFIACKANSELMLRWAALADEYWKWRTVPSGNVGNVDDYRWMDGVLLKNMERDEALGKNFASRPSLPCSGGCSPHMFYSRGCADEVNMPLSPPIRECIDSGNLPPAVKLTMHPRCGNPAVTADSVGTTGYELIQIAEQRSSAARFRPNANTNVSMAEALMALRQTGRAIRQALSKHGGSKCKTQSMGGWGGEGGGGKHDVCELTVGMSPGCMALSYGINNDYSFELDLRNKTGCRVLAMDPTINHPSELAPGVLFLKVGAPTLPVTSKDQSDVLTQRERLSSQFLTLAPPDAVAAFQTSWDAALGSSRELFVLKMDCEGCEYVLYESIVRRDPTFFKRVRQFAVEVHLSRLWIRSTHEMLQYGRLLALLKRAGLTVQHARLDHCGPAHEALGTIPELTSSGYYTPGTGHCQNLLFARASQVTRRKKPSYLG